MAQLFLYVALGVAIVAYLLARSKIRVRQKNVFLCVLTLGAAVIMYLTAFSDPRTWNRLVDSMTGTIMLIVACRHFRLARRHTNGN